MISENQQQRQAGGHPFRDGGPLFRNGQGESWNAQSVHKRLKSLARRTGIKICLYVLRHSFCTDLLANGVDVATTATLMGHRDSRIVMTVYNQLQHRQDVLQEALRRIA